MTVRFKNEPGAGFKKKRKVSSSNVQQDQKKFLKFQGSKNMIYVVCHCERRDDVSSWRPQFWTNYLFGLYLPANSYHPEFTHLKKAIKCKVKRGHARFSLCRSAAVVQGKTRSDALFTWQGNFLHPTWTYELINSSKVRGLSDVTFKQPSGCLPPVEGDKECDKGRTGVTFNQNTLSLFSFYQLKAFTIKTINRPSTTW